MLTADARCSSCGEQIAWRHTVNSKGTTKAMPVNIAETETGNVIVSGDVVTVLTRGQIAGARAHGQKLYTSHFATCPNATDHRSKDTKR